MGPKWQAYQNAKQRRSEVEAWIKHIGATGRRHSSGTDILSLSPAHAVVKLVVAGQYSEGGQNYWDSPKSFNSVLLDVIHDNFDELRDQVLKRLKASESAALIDAKAEVAVAMSDIEKAESEAA